MAKKSASASAAPALFDTSPPVRKKGPAVTVAPKPEKTTLPAKINGNPPGRVSPGNLLTAIIQAAGDPACQPEKMHALLDVRNRLMAEQAHVAFITAYIEMQSELPTIDATGRIEIEGKGGKRGQNTPYATYQEINKVTKPILQKHKFGMLLLPDIGPNNVGVLMRGQLAFVCDTEYGKIVHVEHCAIAAALETGGSKNNVQGVGSSLSYTKRYAAVALLNLISQAPEDRDLDGAAETKPAEPAAKITDKQRLELNKAIAGCGVPFETFCAKYGIDSVKDLPAGEYDGAMTACANFKANQKDKVAHG